MQQHASIVITFCKIQVILIDKYVVVYADKVLNNIVLITLHRKEIRWWHFHSLGNLIYIRFHNVHNVQIDLQRTEQLIVDIVKKKHKKTNWKSHYHLSFTYYWNHLQWQRPADLPIPKLEYKKRNLHGQNISSIYG